MTPFLAVALVASVACVCVSALTAWRWWLAAQRHEWLKQHDAYEVRLKALELRVADAVDVGQRLSKLETANAYSRR